MKPKREQSQSRELNPIEPFVSYRKINNILGRKKSKPAAAEGCYSNDLAKHLWGRN